MSFEPHKQDGALPFSDVTGLLAAAAGAEKQQALVARILVPPEAISAPSSSFDHFARLSSIATQLREFFGEHTRCNDHLDGQDYIWHKEPPSISVVCPSSSSRVSTSSASTQLPPHILLHLRTGGECIEDEWFATHLLIRASSHFVHYQLCINVEDEDGQFLLIEAADYLPEWVTPEAVENRVWIFDGHLHLISPHHNDRDDAPLSTCRAVELVSDSCILTRASDDVEAAAFARAFEFPSAAKQHHHRTLAYLPQRIARVLAVEPQLIANCVTSIQSRDVVSCRSASRLVHFAPPLQDSVRSASSNVSVHDNDAHVALYSVRMTRHLYAQLLYDRFFPPRQLGVDWQAAVEKYRLRLHSLNSCSDSKAKEKIEDETQVQAELHQGRWRDLGAKIWCGMEMSYTDSLARRASTKPRPMASSASTIPAQEYQALIESLNKLGYFQDEIEDSAKWKQLQAKALAQYFERSEVQVGGQSNKHDALLCDTVDHILQQASADTSLVKSLPSNATLDMLREAEDDDSWLQLGPDDVDTILHGKLGSSNDGSRVVDEQDTFKRLGAFNSKMAEFVQTKSDVRGAVFVDEVDADDLQVDDDELLFEDLDEDEQEESIRRQVQERMRTCGHEAKRQLVERLIPRMSEHEWTRKPAMNAQSGRGADEQNEGAHNFLASIDRMAAERTTATRAAAQQKPQTTVAMRQDNHLSAAHAELSRRLASQYMRETSMLLSSHAHHQFDGASDSDDEELEQETSPEIRRQRAEEYDIDPDDLVTTAADAAMEAGWEDIGEPAELDEETEVGNLLEYARISLGLTKEQYQQILDERQSKGKFVPATPTAKKDTQSDDKSTTPAALKLDTFEDVMAAMEDRLHQLQTTTHDSRITESSKLAPKSEQDPAAVNDVDQDKELLAHLVKSGSDLPSSLLPHLGDADHADTIQAEQMQAFLRSFQAQASTTGPQSGSGPVDVLMRRFGLGSLPADQDPHFSR